MKKRNISNPIIFQQVLWKELTDSFYYELYKYNTVNEIDNFIRSYIYINRDFIPEKLNYSLTEYRGIIEICPNDFKTALYFCGIDSNKIESDFEHSEYDYYFYWNGKNLKVELSNVITIQVLEKGISQVP
jgi:hypothetical protein